LGKAVPSRGFTAKKASASSVEHGLEGTPELFVNQGTRSALVGHTGVTGLFVDVPVGATVPVAVADFHSVQATVVVGVLVGKILVPDLAAGQEIQAEGIQTDDIIQKIIEKTPENVKS